MSLYSWKCKGRIYEEAEQYFNMKTDVTCENNETSVQRAGTAARQQLYPQRCIFFSPSEKSTALQSQLTWQSVCRREKVSVRAITDCISIRVRERKGGTHTEIAGKLKCPLCWNLPDGTGQKPGLILTHIHTHTMLSRSTDLQSNSLLLE